MLNQDFETRFSEENSTIWLSIYALVPDTLMFLDFETLKPLFGYMKSVPICMSDKTSELPFDDLNAECSIYKRVLSSLDLRTIEAKLIFEKLRHTC